MSLLQILGLFIIVFISLYNLVDIIIDFDDRVMSSIRLGILVLVTVLALIK